MRYVLYHGLVLSLFATKADKSTCRKSKIEARFPWRNVGGIGAAVVAADRCSWAGRLVDVVGQIQDLLNRININIMMFFFLRILYTRCPRKKCVFKFCENNQKE